MERPRRSTDSGLVDPVLNQANARMTMIDDGADDEAWLPGTPQQKSLLSPWPLPFRAGWLDPVNAPQTAAELAAIRRSIQRGSPFATPRGPTRRRENSAWKALFSLQPAES